MKFLDNIGASMYKSSLEHFAESLKQYKKGNIDGFKQTLWFWRVCERGYANKGLKTLDMYEFVPLLNQVKPIDHLLNQPLEEGELPVLYSLRFNEKEIKDKLEDLV